MNKDSVNANAYYRAMLTQSAVIIMEMAYAPFRYLSLRFV